jgi:hypothetical protein
MAIGARSSDSGPRCGNWAIRQPVDHPTDPDAVLVPLTRGHFAVIDREDIPLINDRNWAAARLGSRKMVYAQANATKDKPYALMHRIILGVTDERQVDHKDLDPLNNRKSNLRIATHSQNQQNTAVRMNSRTGFKGVRYVPRSKLWVARICVNRRRISLGCFHSPEEAAAAYDVAATQLFGEFARTNGSMSS